jgi:succinate dehydrogenase / fumarate reductase cytochrome b subunit
MTQVLTWYRTSIGKKMVVAVTGLVLVGFLIVHMVGNLQIFAGREAINRYSAFLHSSPGLLWTARIVLLVAVLLHMVAIAQLYFQNRAARGVRYRKKRELAATYASRTMYLSGPIVAAYVVYHLLHLTTGDVGPPFIPGDVYQNMVNGFRVPTISILYVVANVLLALHLYHGIWSFTQTVGLSHPKYDRARRRVAQGLTVLLLVGFLSVPVAVLAGFVK